MSRNAAFLAAASAVVALALVLAFVALGPPSRVRGIVLDAAKVSDLGAIARDIDGRYRPPLPLPDRIGPQDFPGYLTEPATSYTYRRDDRRRYDLCATFAQTAPRDAGSEPDDARWAHPAGPGCFTFDADAAPADRGLPVIRREERRSPRSLPVVTLDIRSTFR